MEVRQASRQKVVRWRWFRFSADTQFLNAGENTRRLLAMGALAYKQTMAARRLGPQAEFRIRDTSRRLTNASTASAAKRADRH